MASLSQIKLEQTIKRTSSVLSEISHAAAVMKPEEQSQPATGTG